MPRRDAQNTIRRIQEACDTCRRKKRKCPGERPQCSLCDRLGQECSYRGTTHGGRWPNSRHASPSRTSTAAGKTVSRSSRRQSMQQRQINVSETITDTNQSNRSEIAVSNVALACNFSSVLQGIESIYSHDEFIRKCLEVYFDHLHNQPYPMFVQRHMSVDNVPTEVLSAILALACTLLLDDCDEAFIEQYHTSLSEAAWKTVSSMYVANPPDQLPLSFLQALCLTVQMDLANGNVYRAQTSVALGIRIAQKQRLTASNLSKTLDKEECNRCVWTLFMLDRVSTAGFDATFPTALDRFRLALPVPDDQVLLPSRYSHMTLHDLDLSDDPDSGAMPLVLHAFKMWGKVVEYIFDDDSRSQALPWEMGSYFAQIEGYLLELELVFHPIHRYVAAGFPAKAIAESESRPYFSTWLCFQILLHSTVCTLNHPFVIYEKLHSVAKKVPPTFLQKSYEASMIHSGWVLRLVREMQQADLAIKDPFYAYLVSIAGSIQLEHTRSKHPEIAASAKQNFEIALDYTKQSAIQWRSKESRHQLLLALSARFIHRQAMSHGLQNYNGAVDSQTADNFRRLKIQKEDIGLMRSLLAYARPPAPLTPQLDENLFTLGQGASPTLDTERNELFNTPLIDDWSLFGEPWMSYTNVEDLLNQL